MPKALPFTGNLVDFVAQVRAAKLMNEYVEFARSIGCETMQDEMIVSSQWQMDQLDRWWKEHTPVSQVVQLGREVGCMGTMIERLTDPANCLIATAGDSSWCLSCGHKFDTNSTDYNLPPACRRELDPFRGGRLT